MKEKDRSKIVGDLGLIDDIVELCKNLTSIEAHSFGSYVSNNNEFFLVVSKRARELRTKYLSLITKQGEAQEWCINKHIMESLMRLQECYTRFLSTSQYKEAKKCSEDYFYLFEIFIQLNDFGGKENVKKISSA